MKFFLLFSILFLNFLQANELKEVLLIHSYHKGYIWTDDISKTIEKNFSSDKNIELTTVYMDTKRIDDPSYLANLAKLYKQQFTNRTFDLIIISDNNAFDFMELYYDSLFKNVPVLFCGINNYDKNMLDKLTFKNISGVAEEVDIEKNFELISRLHPNLKNLLIINDTSTTGYAVKKDLAKIIEKYKKRFNIEYTDNLDISDLKIKVSKLEKSNSAILFVLLFKDTTGKYFTHKQSFEEVKKVSEVPIYGLWDFYLNSGMVGGLLTSGISQGETVSKMALDVLNGKDIKDIPILEKSPNLYIFNYNELKRFNLDVYKYVENPIIINEPTSIYKEHIKFFIITIIIIALLSIIVVILKANIQRREKLELELSNRIEFDKVLLDTIPNPIYYKNVEGKFLGCNTSFTSLVNCSRDEVIGKTAFDFFPLPIATKNTLIDQELLNTFSTSTSEFTFYTTSNEMKHIILNKAVYKNIDGSVGGIVCIMDDITERIQQKQFLIQQSKLAEMGDMIAAIAHQWNEPLVELSALIQDIQTSYLLKELKDKNVKEFVNDSMVQIKYMSKTLTDFRNFLKPSTKKQLFSISKALTEINEIIGKQVFYSNIKMNFNYKNKNEELLIYGYENEFKQVLLNIINNAKNKIVENCLPLNKKGNININIKRCSTFNTIEIIDDAGAIDEKVINSIFDPYFTTKQDGMGLGLYMAKVIIEEKMRGSITVRNDENHVIFTIKLHKLNETITKRLKIKNYNVISFTDGSDAYENITEDFSCFILDINVPNIDGIKILKKIREYYEIVPVIIISASVELDIIKQSYDFGCNDYLKKPFFIDELEIKIEKLCNIQDSKIYFDENSYFDFKSATIVIDNQEIRLTKKEKLLINLFLSKKNQVITYENIESYVWEGNFSSLESIRSLIRRVRRIFPKEYIQTIIDAGYIFKNI